MSFSINTFWLSASFVIGANRLSEARGKINLKGQSHTYNPRHYISPLSLNSWLIGVSFFHLLKTFLTNLISHCGPCNWAPLHYAYSRSPFRIICNVKQKHQKSCCSLRWFMLLIDFFLILFYKGGFFLNTSNCCMLLQNDNSWTWWWGMFFTYCSS